MASKREIERQIRQEQALCSLGFTAEEARALRKISLTLRRWYELECGTDAGRKLGFYVQTDPRGAALYILRPGDVPEGADPSACYNRGICVY